MPTARHTWRRCRLRWLQGQQLHTGHSQRLLPQPGHARRRVGGQRAGSVQQVPVEGADGCIAVPLSTASAIGVAARGGAGLVEAAAPLLARGWAGARRCACGWGPCRPCREDRLYPAARELQKPGSGGALNYTALDVAQLTSQLLPQCQPRLLSDLTALQHACNALDTRSPLLAGRCAASKTPLLWLCASLCSWADPAAAVGALRELLCFSAGLIVRSPALPGERWIWAARSCCTARASCSGCKRGAAPQANPRC